MFNFLISPLKDYKGRVFQIFIFSVLATFMGLLIPTVNARIIDNGISNGDSIYVWTRGGIMFFISVLQVCFSIFSIVQGTRTGLLIGRELRYKVYKTILSFSQKDISHFGIPTLITRSTIDVESIILFYSTVLGPFMSIPIMFIGGIGMALYESPPLSTVVIVTIPLILITSALFVKISMPKFRRRQVLNDEVNRITRDQISGIRVVKAFNKEKFETEKLDEVNRDLFDLNVQINRLLAIILPIFTFMVNLAMIVLLWYGGYLAERGTVGVGQIVAFVTYLSLILTSVLSMSLFFILWPQVEIGCKRLLEVFNKKASVVEKTNPVSLNSKKGVVEFNDVTFSFAPEKKEIAPVLKNLNFKAEPGEMTAIIGSIGTGKSTILNLIPRLFDTTEGAVRIDGQDVRDLSFEELNSLIGYVPQKSFLFKGTLADNLRFGNPEATDEELWKALEIAQADSFIKDQKNGLETEVAEGGSNFSGGQRQRLAIARAIVRNPKIYLFDDSFSALDYKTDRELRQALSEYAKDSTLIVVGQRISSIRNAKQIIVLNNGEIEDIGTHEELLKRSKTYQEIAASQPTDEEANNTEPLTEAEETNLNRKIKNKEEDLEKIQEILPKVELDIETPQDIEDLESFDE